MSESYDPTFDDPSAPPPFEVVVEPDGPIDVPPTDEPAPIEDGPGQFDPGDELFTVSPQPTDISSLVGPGHDLDSLWRDQGDTNYCALYSVRGIVSEMKGYDVDIDEVLDHAVQNNWLVYDESGQVQGVAPDNIDDLLDSFAVPSHSEEGEQGAMQRLEAAFAADRRVVVALDGDEISARADDGTALDADHAVAVTGIDYARDVVIMNDSARGPGLEVPLDTFFESWRDSNFQMTVTDGAGPGFALLGMTLHPRSA